MFENFEIPKELIPSDNRFGAGPSLVPPEHLVSLAQTGKELLGTSHRQKAVKDLVAQLQEGLLKYFKAPKDYQVVLGNGGATLLFDMIGLGIVKKKSTHYTCGEFSQKWHASHKKIPWIETDELNVEFGHGNIPKETHSCDTVCFTLNETSTGVQNTQLPKVDDSILLCVDATSGAGQVPCDLSKVDLFFFSPQKVFAAEGGLWVAIMSPKAIKRAIEVNDDKGRYIPGIMNWKNAIENGSKGQTYNTPSISTIFLLNEQVKKMNDLGLEKVIKLAKDKADLVYGWAKDKSYLSTFVEDENFRSLAVATINIDESIPASDITKLLRQNKVALDIEAYRKLGKNQLRIGMFHNISIDDLRKLTNLISKIIESERG